eukprot:TRINITY_DN69431_c0_g1_i1.p1 TRINITY_DN69431_c0_g1~~TRINITY_DN69431_c0_g1_i1.p1  ORF type:complete len:241 (-),score=50.44 TRINITY_DN69431_c0_g1_i1:91-813(-)
MTETAGLKIPADLERSISLLGPLLTDMIHRLEDLDARVKNLTVAVEQKADNGHVPTFDQFRAVCDTVSLKADHADISRLSNSVSGLAERLEAYSQEQKTHVAAFKAHALKAPSLEQFDVVKNALAERAMKGEVPTVAQFQALSTSVARKADTEWAMAKLESVNAVVRSKANLDAVPTLEKFDEMHVILAEKADIHWTRKQLKDVGDILVPVARAVRGLQGSHFTPNSMAKSKSTPFLVTA